MKIFLIGPMGSGKSKIGKLLAEKLNLTLIDTDKDIETKYEKKIVEIFESEGEREFRKKESQFFASLTNLTNTIISTGGGIVESPSNIELLKKEKLVIFLNASVQKQHESTKGSKKRPLLNNTDSRKVLEHLYSKRLDLYQMVATLELNGDNLSNEEIVEEIISFINV
jgi:shikimate kinase|tara:strand:- start:508 stop:1011 length:504 start_codon:yes stop_codon:yes gene_type:complete